MQNGYYKFLQSQQSSSLLHICRVLTFANYILILFQNGYYKFLPSQQSSSLLYIRKAQQLILHSFLTWAGYSCHNFRGQIWSKPRIVQRVFNIGCGCDMLICSSIWMVMGPTWLDSPKWDISIRNPVSRAKHHSCCKPSVHFYYSTSLPCPSLLIQVWNIPLFCWLDYHNDHLCFCVLTWNQRHSHWRDGIYVEEALVLEKDTSWDRWC